MRAPMTAPGTAAMAMYSRSSARRWLTSSGSSPEASGGRVAVDGRAPCDQRSHDEADEDRECHPQRLEAHAQAPDRDDRVEGEHDDGAGRRRGAARRPESIVPGPWARPEPRAATRSQRPCRGDMTVDGQRDGMIRPRHGTAERLEASRTHDDTHPFPNRHRHPRGGDPGARCRCLHGGGAAPASPSPSATGHRGIRHGPTVPSTGVTPVPDITPKPGVSRVPGLPGSPVPRRGRAAGGGPGGRGRRGDPGRRGCLRRDGRVGRVRDLAQWRPRLPEAGVMYTQALTPGYRVVVEAGGDALRLPCQPGGR